MKKLPKSVKMLKILYILLRSTVLAYNYMALKNKGLLNNISVIFKGLFYSENHLFLIYTFYGNLALAVYFYIKNEKIISYVCLIIGISQYIMCILYDDRYKQLQKKHNLLLNCYDSLPSLFLILDKNWNVIFANDIFQAFSIGKNLTTFEDVLECFSENSSLCEVLLLGKNTVEQENYFSETIDMDEHKAWKIYMGVMKKSNRSCYVCYISDIQKNVKTENENIRILDDLPEGIISYNNKEIIYNNKNISNIMKSYNITPEEIYNTILEQEGKKVFFLFYQNDRDKLIIRFDKIYQDNDGQVTYRTLCNEGIINYNVSDAMTGIVLLDNNFNIVESNSKFNNLVSSYFVRKTSIFQYVESTYQGTLKQYFKDKEKSFNKEVSPVNVVLGDKNGNLVKCYGEQLQNCGWVLYIHDNNVQRELEVQLLHSQRLGLLGQVLSAVSHDFNNILTAISGFCDLLCSKISLMDDKYFALVQIKHNINRAINLVKYILYLSKKNEARATVFDQESNVNDIISHLLSNMGRLLGESISINFIKSDKNIVTNVPAINVEQILLNLIVNARDAMKNNGVITITTTLITDVRFMEPHSEVLEQGEYVEISVTDTGEGISEQNKKKIFDSFFTTKKEGTGLGLSTIQSIVRQYKGLIKVNSKLNVGTTFKIYLPAKEYSGSYTINQKEENETKSHKSNKLQKMNVILLEDDLSLNQLFESSLKQKEYVNVFSYKTIKDAIEKATKMLDSGEEIHVIIADVIIKDGNSLEMIEKIVLNSPMTKFLLISGHDREYLEKLNNYSVFQNKKHDITFLQKPFSLDVIGSMVESIYKKFNS